MDFLNRMDPEGLVMLGLIVPGMFLGAVVLTVYMFLKHRAGERELALKQQMLEKGLSIEEIERVIKGPDWLGFGVPVRLPAKAQGPGFEKARLVQQLVEQGMDADGVEKVLRALGDYADEELPAKVTAVQGMVEAGMGADDVERVIRAFQRNPVVSTPEARPTGFREGSGRD
jgi:hypothetical protein